MTELPTAVLHGLVDAGARELLRRGEPLQFIGELGLQGALKPPEKNPSPQSPIVLADGRVQVIPNYGGVRVDGRLVELPPKVYGALFCLASNADEFVTRDQLLRACWPQSPPNTRNCLSQIVRRIRRVLGTDDLGDTSQGVIRTIQQRGWVALTSLRDDPQAWI